jgi:hypothetical protein
MTQLSFATLDHRNKKKQTKRERFVSEMDVVVPWAALLGLREPHYPKAGKVDGQRCRTIECASLYYPSAIRRTLKRSDLCPHACRSQIFPNQARPV